MNVVSNILERPKGLSDKECMNITEVFRNSMQLIQHQSLDTLHNPNIVSEIWTSA